MTISCFMWTNVLIHTGSHELDKEHKKGIGKILKEYDINPITSTNTNGFTVWEFGGINESRRRLINERVRSYLKEEGKDYTLSWHGAESLIREAHALNEFIQ